VFDQLKPTLNNRRPKITVAERKEEDLESSKGMARGKPRMASRSSQGVGDGEPRTAASATKGVVRSEPRTASRSNNLA
jgi:hypothetical protein